MALAPFGIYRAWYDNMVRCSGVVTPRVPFDSIRFYAVMDTVIRLPRDTNAYGGLAFPERGIIYLVQPGIFNERLVSHEILHVVLPPHRGHPTLPFEWPCNVN